MDTKDRIIEKQKELDLYIDKFFELLGGHITGKETNIGYYGEKASCLIKELSALTEQGEKENKELSTCDSCGHQNEEICNSCNCL